MNHKELVIFAPSRSKPGEMYKLNIFKGGDWNCKCPACYWAKAKREYTTKCRHYWMVTLKTCSAPMPLLIEALAMLQNKKIPMEDSWDKMKICCMPKEYSLTNIYCKDCPLYPNWCNKHPTRFENRKTSKPLIWRIQSSIMNGRRKDAVKLAKQFIKIVSAVRNEK